MLIPLTSGDRRPKYEQLYSGVRQAILNGRLPPGTRLPSTRTWAAALGVSRFTVVDAIERLLAEGYLTARRGVGTFVAASLPEQQMTTSGPSKPGSSTPAPLLDSRARTAGLSARGLALGGVVITGPRQNDMAPRPFHPRRPPLDVFPIRTWRRLLRRQWTRKSASLLDYGPPAGHAALREAIARHVGMTRSVRCEPEQVIVTSGSQQAFDLLFKVLLDPGDEAWIEEPGYLDVRAALIGGGASLAPVPVDADGMDVDAGIHRAPAARVVVVSPSHQYPTGATLSAPRRTQLLNWARGTGAWIVEDDYDSYFRYRGHPMSALQGVDSDVTPAGDDRRNVVYVGTFSKTMFPALRLGYCVVPESLTAAVANARAVADRHSPTLTQAALAAFIDEGHYDRHLRRVRVVCQERHATMRAHLSNALGRDWQVMPAAAGTHLLVRPSHDEHADGVGSIAVRVAQAAALEDLVVFPVSRYCVELPEHDGLVLGYGSFTPRQIEEGVARLARCAARVVA